MDANFESFKNSSEVDQQGYVLVIGATDIPRAVDHALKKPGLLAYKIKLGVPDENTRFEILSILTTTKRLGDCCNHYKKHRFYRRIKNNASEKILVSRYASSTLGFLGADLEALVMEASTNAIWRILGQKDSDDQNRILEFL
ncbi:P-loop containing nucleoside triphosphate hydrolase [Trema orientale]|uniref:P-loop containing nucleoside triphosphate hydrolase n=1 Tax=Trema orientale TaxID=63057 RepID=A0A2P5D996_TREOI|nr:P-loop containing nucleoside triphosphate hydrolase [Trema orientale]